MINLKNQTKIITITLILGLIITTGPIKSEFQIKDTTETTKTIQGQQKNTKIYSWSPHTSKILKNLGVEKERIVGLANASGYHPKYYRENLLKRQPPDRIFGSSYSGTELFSAEYYVEKFSNISDDAIIAPDSVSEDINDIKNQVGEDFHFEPVYVKGTRAQNFEEIYNDIKITGELTGKKEKASTIINEMQNKIDNIQKHLNNVEDRKEVVFLTAVDTNQTNDDYPRFSVAYPSVHTHAIIQNAGMINKFTTKPKNSNYYFYPVGWKDLISKNPEAIIYTKGGWGPNPKEVIMNNKDKLRGIKAVEEGNFYGIDIGIVGSPGIQTANAVDILGKKVHPKAFMEDKKSQDKTGVGMRVSPGLVKVHQSVDNPSSSVGLIKKDDSLDLTLENDDKTHAVTGFNTTFNKYLGNVYLDINYLGENNEQIPRTKNAFSYTNITLRNAENKDLKNSSVTFRIPKTWLVKMNASKNDITLEKLEDNKKWEELETKIVNEPENYFKYVAKSDGYGLFSATAQTKIQTSTQIDQDIANTILQNTEKELIVGNAAANQVKTEFTTNTLKFKDKTYKSKWKEKDYGIIQIKNETVRIVGTHRFGTKAATKYYQTKKPEKTTLINWKDKNNDQTIQSQEISEITT